MFNPVIELWFLWESKIATKIAKAEMKTHPVIVEISIEISTKIAKAEMETHPVIVEITISEY